MKYGFVLPRGDARTAATLAAQAEAAGWDGFFVWEPVWGVERLGGAHRRRDDHRNDPPRHHAHPAAVIWEGTTAADDPAAAADTVARWADAGTTWWLEADWSGKDADAAALAESYRRRIRSGPPRPHASQ